MSRPEHTAPPEIFYNDDEAKKYTTNSRVAQIQAEMTERALELLGLGMARSNGNEYDSDENDQEIDDDNDDEDDEEMEDDSDEDDQQFKGKYKNKGKKGKGKKPVKIQEKKGNVQIQGKSCFLLDIGCGSGLSGEIITEYGHYWIGVDISKSMLDVARDREVEGDLMLSDIGQGLPFKPATFDGAISISVIQWLCNADKASHKPFQRLTKFFQTLYMCLCRGAKAVFQFYPENPNQIEMITTAAMKAGFTGGLVIDYPNSTKRKKYFLCLFAGIVPGQVQPIPKGLDDHDDDKSRSQVQYTEERERDKDKCKGKKRRPVKDRDWVLHKKETNRRRGKEVPQDSKYTGRKRGIKF